MEKMGDILCVLREY